MPTYRVKVRRVATITMERMFEGEEADTPEQAVAAVVDVAGSEWPWQEGWYEPDGYGLNMEWTSEPTLHSVEEIE